MSEPESCPIPTSEVPPGVDGARRALTAAFDHPDGLSLEQRSAFVEALAVLEGDVVPPYPPLPAGLPPVDPADATRQALTHLGRALNEVTAVADLTRIALTALVLRRGGGVVP